MSQLLQFYKSFQQARLPAVKTAPTFEDLTIDDKLTEHQRVIRYVKSKIPLQRLFHVKMIGDVIEKIGFSETVNTIVPLLGPLAKDTELVVKQHLVEQLKLVAKFCCSNGENEGYQVVLDTILPITASLLEDDKQEVRQGACNSLVEIATLIKPEDLGQHVLTIILRLAHEDDKEETRMTAAQLLNLLAECLGQDLCRQFVIPEIVSLAEDPVFRVRKATALNFHSICKVGGEHELLERLMPAFVRLSKDEMYRVRRACVESLSEISKNVSEDIRIGVLVEIFLRLAHDPSKFVKQSVLQQSGLFIATLPTKAVSDSVLTHYKNMVFSPSGDATVDNEMRHICAYTFPAVFQVVGKERWKDLRDLYHNLVQSRNSNILQTLAYSLHELAKILEDRALVEQELAPIFEEFFQGPELVQIGVIKHLASFMRMLPDLCCISYLPILHEILHSTNPFNWRLRQYLAFQLSDLVSLPPKADAYRTLFPTVITLLQDPVASVRRESFVGMASLLNCIYEVALNKDGIYNHDQVLANQHNLEEVTHLVNQFILSDKCQLRQLWAELCSQLLKDLDKDFFLQYFIQGVTVLTSDPVFNVRYAVSQIFVSWEPQYLAPWEIEESDTNHPWKWFLSRKDIKECIKRLSVDDRDVVLNVSKLQPYFPEIEFKEISCRGMKEAPGGKAPVSLDDSSTPFAPQVIQLNDSTISESIINRLRSNSASSLYKGRSSSIDCSSDDAAIHSMNRLSITPNDEDDQDNVNFSTTENNVTEPESEYINSYSTNPSVLEELDIIDGLIKSPQIKPHTDNSVFKERKNSDDEEEEEIARDISATLSPEIISPEELSSIPPPSLETKEINNDLDLVTPPNPPSDN